MSRSRKGPVEGLLSLAQALSSALPLAARLTELCRVTTEVIGCDRSSIFLREGDYCRAKYNHGNPPDIAKLFARHKVSLRDPLIARVMATRSCVPVNDALNSRLMDAKTAKAARIRSIVVAPLLDESERSLGFITAEYNENPGPFTKEMSTLVLGFAKLAQMAVVANQRQAQQRQAQAALRESEERFRSLSGAALEGIVVHEGGKILDVNEAYARMFGYEPSEVIGAQVLDHVAPQSRNLVSRNVLSGYARPYEAVGVKKDGSTFPVEACGKTISYRKRKVRVAATRDITERKQAEEALRSERDRAQKYLDVAEVIIVGINAKGQVTLINQKGCAVLGYDEKEIVGKNWFDLLLPTAVREEVRTVFRRLMAGEIEPVEYYENPVRTGRGEERLIAWHNAVLRDDAGGIVGTLSSGEDVTERRRAEEALREREGELRQLTARLLDVQEDERRAVARELHDEIGQLLTGLSLTLETCVRSPQQATSDRLHETQGLVDELMSRVRDLSLDLRPAMLDDLGLLPALLWHLQRYASRTGVRVDFKHNGLEERFAPEVETAAYRIIQEALTNTARHAGVSEMTVRARADRDTLRVRIEDRGIGFDPSAVLAAGHASGLAGMHERAALCGGQLTINSKPGDGTRLTLKLPAGGTAGQRKR